MFRLLLAGQPTFWGEGVLTVWYCFYQVNCVVASWSVHCCLMPQTDRNLFAIDLQWRQHSGDYKMNFSSWNNDISWHWMDFQDKFLLFRDKILKKNQFLFLAKNPQQLQNCWFVMYWIKSPVSVIYSWTKITCNCSWEDQVCDWIPRPVQSCCNSPQEWKYSLS